MCSGKCLWRYILLFIGILHSTQAASLRCYKETLDDAQVFPLTQPQLLVNSSCINHEQPTIVFAFGYMGKVTGPATTAVLSAYLATKKRNVVLLDWEKEAESGTLGPEVSYASSAVPNAKSVGDDLGEALTVLASAGMNMTLLHLLGHSLGAHVMGYAGRRARENGHVVARITGLDPAGALFEAPLKVGDALDRACARFVDIIHSDPGGYGITVSTGTADFWPNYSGNDGTQPGCPIGHFKMFSSEDLCSHDRSWRLFVESIGSPTAFPSAAATDYKAWVSGDAQTTPTVYMGELVNTSASGNFYLTTGPTSPYSLGERGLVPADN